MYLYGSVFVSRKWCFLTVLMFCVFGFSLTAQSNVSVPVHNEIYYVLEMAQMKGLLSPLPGAKPYTKKQILEAIDTIFNTDTGGVLSEKERDILQRSARAFRRDDPGLNWQRGTYSFAKETPRMKIPITGEVGAGIQVSFSGGVFAEGKDPVWGADNLFTLYTNGDVGEHFSYRFNFLGFLTRASRDILGNDYLNYYEGFERDKNGNYEKGYINEYITTYSEPLAFFPYTYRKTWDGFVVEPGEISATGLNPWPQHFAIAPMLLGEMDGAFFDEVITWRFGRLRREWGGMDHGHSLVFNSTAQPFMALEATFKPASWFSFSALTGSLEYNYDKDMKLSAWNEQNNFSIEVVELNYKNRFHLDFGSTAVWPNRFQLGYPFPVKNNFLYQDALGDLDNMGFFFNIKGQRPGLGKIWFSAFLDEIDPDIKQLSKFFEMDRKMYATQAGAKAVIPGLPFSSISLIYTKIEPYTYTHNRNYVPWNNNTYDGKPMPMETAYMNAGVGLGYYLPPNSDELLIRFDTMPALNTTSFFQYQMIVHGAAHGPHSVDGSSYSSELDPNDRNENLVLRKFFLRDGAYNWQHIFMIGGEHTITKFRVPLRVFAKTGVVYSFYTDIDGKPNSGQAFDYKYIDTPVYPKTTEFILTLGMRIYM
ncbi:hypothetical protein AGMMS49546_21870 [Spirochaetia bacterium]|nr:hypothetical protein AGMMS49546_21870 [Spirochaetia bacterium]